MDAPEAVCAGSLSKQQHDTRVRLPGVRYLSLCESFPGVLAGHAPVLCAG